MSQEYIEITERTVNDAVTAACQKLGVPSERIEYEVIDQGKSGFLGIGARAAKIRARIRSGEQEIADIDTAAIISGVLSGKDKGREQGPDEKSSGKKEKTRENRKGFGKQTEGRKESGKRTEEKNHSEKMTDGRIKSENKTGRAVETGSKKEESAVQAEKIGPADQKAETEQASGVNPAAGAASDEAAPEFENSRHGYKEKNEGRYDREGRDRRHRKSRRYDREEPAEYDRSADSYRESDPAKTYAPKKRSAVPDLTDEQIEEVRRRADVFLMDVFHAMDLEAEVSSTYDKETGMLSLDMKGENMGILIGKRGQTLDSLQYLVSLVVNKGIDGYIHVKADTENYRERRKKTLENLAKNIASKVKRSHESVALEPMNPYERRIIHSALQGDRYVTTYSEGEEPYRKVIVIPKE